LVVPSKSNAFLLEVTLLDYFAFTDRAVALQVRREKEFAVIHEGVGPNSPESARLALQTLHRNWLISAGSLNSENSSAVVEVSPLLSYEGEALSKKGTGIQFPCHLVSIDETTPPEDKEPVHDPSNVELDVTDGLDTRLYYMQEYPRRMQMSQSHAPQFRTNSRASEAAQKQAQPALANGLQGAAPRTANPLLWQDMQLAFPCPAKASQ
jgi:hypothetical protein